LALVAELQVGRAPGQRAGHGRPAVVEDQRPHRGRAQVERQHPRVRHATSSPAGCAPDPLVPSPSRSYRACRPLPVAPARYGMSRSAARPRPPSPPRGGRQPGPGRRRQADPHHLPGRRPRRPPGADTRSMRKREEIRLGEHGAVEVLFTRDGRTVYASQMEAASVWEIDRRSFRVRRRLPTKGNWSKVMALSPDERTLYVANWVSSDISEIDLRKGKVRRLLKTVRTPRGLWPPPDGKRLYVAGFEDGELQRIDLATGKARILLRTGGAMRHLVGDPKGRRLYADDMGTNQAFVGDPAPERGGEAGRPRPPPPPH